MVNKPLKIEVTWLPRAYSVYVTLPESHDGKTMNLVTFQGPGSCSTLGGWKWYG